MKNITSLLLGCLLLASGAYAQAPLSHAVARAATRAVVRKPYYANDTVAHLCEAWKKCAVWAQHAYQHDATFRITYAQEVVRFRVYRHTARYETMLDVHAISISHGKTIQKSFDKYSPARR